MKIKYVTGDLLAAPEKAIAHGCNAQGKMGSGVAKAVRARYPAAFKAYHDAYERGDLQLGSNVWAPCDPHLVVNCITQKNYGYDGKVFVDYDAIASCMRHINAVCIVSRTMSPFPRRYGEIHAIAMPLIGAGLGGGSWTRIAGLIEEAATDFEPVVYTLDGVIPTS